MTKTEKLRKKKINELMSEYNVSNSSDITVGSYHILGQFSLLNRHRKGNEERIEKLKDIINNNSEKTKFAHEIKLNFNELLEIYDVSKYVDLDSVEGILRRQKYETNIACFFEDSDNECTKALEYIESIEKVNKGELYFEVNNRKISLEISGQYGIGREHGNVIWIDEETVSRRHACITVERNAVFLEDLKSSNGTWVNNIAINRKTRLKEGDIITVGRVKCFLKKE